MKNVLLIIAVLSATIINSQTVVYPLNAANFHSNGTLGSYDACGNTIYNKACTQDWGFGWTSTGSQTPVSITVEFDFGIQCGTVTGTKTPSFNGQVQSSSFSPNGACSCTASSNPKSFTLNPSDYVVGGANLLTIDYAQGVSSGTCEGVSSAGSYAGTYGQVTVVYSNPCTDPDVPNVTSTPSTICPSSSSTLSWTGNLNDATHWSIYTGSCGGTLLTTTSSNTINVSPSTTTTYYIRGEGGCVTPGSCDTTVVTVSDVENPTITCPGNQTGNVDASCTFSLPDYTGLATPADNCSGVTVTQVPAPGTNVGVGTTNIVLTATDGSSNTANCNFDVVVSDATNPTITCPGNQTGNVDASCTFSLPDYTGLATPADNCPGVTVTQVPAPGTNVGVGTTNIVLTATDGSSNTANCNFDVVVSDVTNPTITCPGNQTGNVDASCTFSLPDYTGVATPADNCPGVTVTQVPAPGTNVGVGTTNIVLTATDGSSNTANCNFDVVVSDVTNPTITCPGNQTGNVDASCTFSLPDYTGLATPADNCSGVTVTQVPAPGTNVGVGTTNIVLTATDGSSNTANCNFDVVVSDVTNPTITCPGNQTGNVDASCTFSLPDYTGLATPADNCPGVTVTQVPAPGTNVGVGTTNIVLTATDGSSNTANCNFDVIVSDVTNPTITCPGNQTGNVDASCTFSLPDYTGLATPADNCPGVTVTQVPAPGTNVGVGTTNIVLTATDASSNTANCNFDVIVSDVTNPTITCPGNQTGNVDASCTFSLPDYTGLATPADNCPGVTVTQVPAPGTNVGVGTTNIVLTATDGSSNSANCNFDVIVSDVTNPTISCPGDQNVVPTTNCQFTLPDYTGMATANDNCPGSPNITQSPVAGTNLGLGTTIVVLTAEDGAGNVDTCSFNVNVNSAITGTLDSTICNGTSFVFNGTTYDGTNNSGTETLTAANGCDSVVTVTVTELSALTGSVTDVICEDDSVIVNGTVYNASNPSGTEVFNNIGANGCDSTVTVSLTINNFAAATDVHEVCDSLTWIDGVTYFVDNNTATYTYPNSAANGCDSVVTLNLTVNSVNTNVTDNSPTLTADEVGASYKWVDCDNGFALINGEENQSFTATSNGNYAVIVTLNNCTDTSNCFNVTGIGIEEVRNESILVRPNPTSGMITISMDHNIVTEASLEILNVVGQIIYRAKISSTLSNIDLSNQEDGIYFVKIKTSSGTEIIKVIKQ